MSVVSAQASAPNLQATSPFFDWVPIEVTRNNIFSYVDPTNFISLSKVCKKFYNLIWDHESSPTIPGNNFKRFLAERYLSFQSKIMIEQNRDHIANGICTNVFPKGISEKATEYFTTEFSKIFNVIETASKIISNQIRPIIESTITHEELLNLICAQENPIWQSGMKKIMYINREIAIQIGTANEIIAKKSGAKLTEIINNAQELNRQSNKVEKSEHIKKTIGLHIELLSKVKKIKAITPAIPAPPVLGPTHSFSDWLFNIFTHPKRLMALNATIFCTALVWKYYSDFKN